MEGDGGDGMAPRPGGALPVVQGRGDFHFLK